jgi:hypothetical protein
MKRDGLFLIAILTALVAWAPKLFADDRGSQFGAMWGLSVPDADNTNAFHIFGVKGEAFLVPQFSAGGYYLQSDKTGELSTSNKFRYSLTGIEAAYHIPTAKGDTFISFRMGMTKLQRTVATTDVTYSPYHYGIATGYDFFISSMFSIGFEGSYLHVLPGRSITGGTTYDQNSFNLINFLVSLQFRL